MHNIIEYWIKVKFEICKNGNSNMFRGVYNDICCPAKYFYLLYLSENYECPLA